jgi:hypothetical protein
MSTVKYPEVKVRLVGEDGNAFSILARVATAMRRQGVSVLEVNAFRRDATSGDYDNLLRTCLEWVSCDIDADDYEEDEDVSSRRCGWCDELHEDCECDDE